MPEPIDPERAKQLAICAEKFRCKADLYRYMTQFMVSLSRYLHFCSSVPLPASHPELSPQFHAADMRRREGLLPAAPGQAGEGACMARALAIKAFRRSDAAPRVQELHSGPVDEGLQDA